MQKLKPVFKDYLWGGEKLKSLFGKQRDGIIAESWEASIHPDGQSVTDNGITFANYLANTPNAVDLSNGEFGILIKYIDAKTSLSVQVHPNDDYARRVENDNGKMETWYIVDADEGAGIYCGLNQEVAPSDFLQAVNDGTVEKYLNFVPVQKGDNFLILPGTVHAIGAGCVICEIQQSSNVTYRVYDYNRTDANGNKRPLHVQKAMEVIDFSKCDTAKVQNERVPCEGGYIRQLAKCVYFDCKELTLQGQTTVGCDLSFTTLNVVEGKGSINGIPFVAGDTFFLRCGERAIVEGRCTVVLTTK